MRITKPILISGIQPSGRLHVGNYLGALRHFVALQNSGKYKCFFFVADLHSLTEPFLPKEKNKQIVELVADFLAAGIDPRKSTLFLQSDIPEHGELAFILNTLTPIGELRRMTQFKDKDGGQETANVGLFTYPTLMAADIIIYDAKFVPVGEDQLQHLELTRMLARKFNARFGKTFAEPQPLLTETPRVMSLDNPEKKMSKSSPKGCLFLDDSPNEIRTKIMSAVTDSGSAIVYDQDKKPGLANLLRIYAAFSQKLIPDIEQEFRGKGYGAFKKALAEEITVRLAEFRKRKSAFIKKPSAIKKTLGRGSKIAARTAKKKMALIRKKIGIAP